MDFIKIKNFPPSKGNIKEVKKQTTGCKEMLGIHFTGGLDPELYQELQINTKLRTQFFKNFKKIRKWTEHMKIKYFTKEDIQITNKSMVKFSTSLVIYKKSKLNHNIMPLQTHQNG